MFHWDGKMFPEIRGGRSMDRIAVLVTGYGHEKLPDVSDGSKREAGPSCIDLVQEQHLPERMKGLSLDISESNAGIRDPMSGKRRLSISNFLTYRACTICLRSLPGKYISVFKWT